MRSSPNEPMNKSTDNTNSRTCVIAQPTFIPWIGWFDLADQSDVMIILDDVQFSKQSWQQRNRLRTPQGLDYLSVSVKSATSDGRRYEDTRSVEIKPGEVTRLDADVTRTAPKEEPPKRPSRVPFERA